MLHAIWVLFLIYLGILAFGGITAILSAIFPPEEKKHVKTKPIEHEPATYAQELEFFYGPTDTSYADELKYQYGIKDRADEISFSDAEEED